MKRKLALLLTVTMLATSVYTPWLANAAEFTSGEENSLYTEEKPETEEIEEEPEADTEEAGEEEVQEDILSGIYCKVMLHNLLMCSLTHGFSGLLISNQSFQGIDPLFFCGAHPAIFSVFDHVFHLTVTAHDTRNLYKGSLCPLILGFTPVEQAVL